MEKKFSSQIYTTQEQSKRLLELGLKPETADMYERVSEDGLTDLIDISDFDKEYLKNEKENTQRD